MEEGKILWGHSVVLFVRCAHLYVPLLLLDWTDGYGGQGIQSRWGCAREPFAFQSVAQDLACPRLCAYSSVTESEVSGSTFLGVSFICSFCMPW